MPKRPFGWELLVDIYGVAPKVCDDLQACYDFLENLVQVLGVEKQAPPFIFRTNATRFPDKAGLSGWVALVESGIQVHTLTTHRFICFDIYSCKPFNMEAVKRFVQEHFRPKAMDCRLVKRGIHYATRNLRTPRSRRHRPCGG